MSPESKSSTTDPTPGPWELRSFDESQTVILGPKDDQGHSGLIAIVSVGRGCPNGAANARLMAAAPMLLDACKEAMIDHWEDCDSHWHGSEAPDHVSMLATCDCPYKALHAAIAAAEPPAVDGAQ